MKDVDELRSSLRADMPGLRTNIFPDQVRRRARAIRVRRAATATAAAVLGLAAIAVPTTLVLRGSEPASTVAGASSPCPTALWSAEPIDTGTVLHSSAWHADYDVLIGLLDAHDLVGGRDGVENITFVVALRDRATGVVGDWDGEGVERAPSGDFPGKYATDPDLQYVTEQIHLGPHSVLDVGVYSRVLSRVTVESEGRSTDAHLAPAPVAGWTMFWIQRDATPLPDDSYATTTDYTGPERVTLTAYDTSGQLMSGLAGRQGTLGTPRDSSPPPVPPGASPSPSPATGC